jgi:translocation and assembly module TamB
VRVDSVGATSAPLPDITHVNAPAKVNRTRLFAGTLETSAKTAGTAYLLDLGISAPSRIFVRGRGLDAEFGGALRLRGDTTNIVTSGGFDLVRGRMSFLTKRFDLSEGRISLQGDPIPYMRLVATTQSADASFDVTLEGTADAPDFSITADPEMPQDEALARILFGETLSDISPLQATRLAAAVATLTGSGSGFNPLGSLREGAGVDDLDLKSDEEGNTSLTAGKYISDNIYTEIEIDNTGKSAISLNLDVSPNLTVTGQADSEANSGLGLFFQKDY